MKLCFTAAVVRLLKKIVNRLDPAVKTTPAQRREKKVIRPKETKKCK